MIRLVEHRTSSSDGCGLQIDRLHDDSAMRYVSGVNCLFKRDRHLTALAVHAQDHPTYRVDGYKQHTRVHWLLTKGIADFPDTTDLAPRDLDCLSTICMIEKS